MIYALLAFLILGLIIYIIDSLYNAVMFLGIFFVDSFWGLATIVSGTITILLFYASGRTYIDSKIKESFLINPKNLMKISGSSDTNYSSYLLNNQKGEGPMSSNVVVNSGREIDLSNCQMDVFSQKMAYLMTKPEAIFFKGWANKRLRLDVEHMYIVRDYIEAMRSAGESFLNFKADQILSYEKLHRLIQINRNTLLKKLRESELEIDLLQEEHFAKVARLRIDIKNLEADVFEKLAHIEHLKANIDQILSDIKNVRDRTLSDIKVAEEKSLAKIKKKEKEIELKEIELYSNIELRQAEIEMRQDRNDAEIYVMKLKAEDHSKLEKQRAKVLDKIIEEMKMDNIKPTHVYLLIKLLDSSDADDYTDFDNKVKLMNEEFEKMKAQTRIINAEADHKEAEASERKAEADSHIKDIKNPYA